MNDSLIVAVSVLLADSLRALGHRTHPCVQTTDSAVLTVGVIAACQFQSHHERALCTLRAMGYRSEPLSVSRFNRRCHARAQRLSAVLDLLAAVFIMGEGFVIDSLPLPVCRRARAGRCRKGRGGESCGYAAAPTWRRTRSESGMACGSIGGWRRR